MVNKEQFSKFKREKTKERLIKDHWADIFSFSKLSSSNLNKVIATNRMLKFEKNIHLK